MSLFVSREQRSKAKWTKRDKKRESDKGKSETKVKGSGEQKRPEE